MSTVQCFQVGMKLEMSANCVTEVKWLSGSLETNTRMYVLIACCVDLTNLQPMNLKIWKKTQSGYLLLKTQMNDPSILADLV